MSIIVYLIAVCIYFLLYRNDNNNDIIIDYDSDYKNNYDYYYYDKNYDIIYYEKKEKKSRKD